MVELADSIARAGVWTVSALVSAIASLVEQGLPACTVGGEISGLARAASGHCYFTLKDAAGGAAIRCAMFRRAASLLDFAPADGQRVEIRGRVTVYEPRGELQFIVEAMRPAGAGALYERFLRLRSRLEAEGLFDPAAKRVLPAHPRAIGIVTSLDAAALHDVATTLARRSPHVRVVVYPSLVQGEGAPASLCTAIALASARGEVDVLIVCRGGGSLEDLWAFNDERVVRAIRGSRVHVVSGVGHETDVTLADLAADLRAPTPTAAAELVAPMTAEREQALDAIRRVMARRMHSVLDTEMQRLDRLALRLTRPSEATARRRRAVDLLARRLALAPRQAIDTGRVRCAAANVRVLHARRIALARSAARLDAAETRLRAVDPERVLARGYALLADPAGRPIVSVAQLTVGGEVLARLADGRASLTTAAVAADRPGS